jgi:uncharacterized membrane protein
MNTPVWIRIVGALGIAWNALGVISYLAFVGIMAPMEPQPEVAMPMLVHAGYAVGVFGAVLGCLGLALAKRWATPVLWLSFIGLVIDWGWVFTATSQGSVPLGAAVLVVSLALALLANHAAKRGWLT